MSTITMSLGVYNFVPVPLININKEYHKSADGTLIGSTIRIGMEGTLFATGNSLADVTMLQSNMKDAFQVPATGCAAFVLQCGGITLISGSPRVNSLQFTKSTDNWVFTSPYTAELEWNDYTIATGNNYITEASESWQFEFVQDKTYYDLGSLGKQDLVGQITHNLSAKGIKQCVGGVTTPGWMMAKSYVGQMLSNSNVTSSISGNFINFDIVKTLPVNHMRNVNYNIYDGSYQLNETMILLPTGGGYKITEEFTVTTHNTIDNPLVSVSIDGHIQGYETKDYTTIPVSITQSKWSAASGYWNYVNGILYNRANQISNAPTLNIIPISQNYIFSPAVGTIGYTYEYNNRPSNCVSGSLIESITYNDTNPTDIFASIPVLGRLQGPVLQALRTKTVHTKEVNVEIVMPLVVGCNLVLYKDIIKGQVATGILIPIQATITGLYAQVFLSQDNDSWNPRTGRYTRNVTWTVQDCNDITSPGVY